MGLITSASVPDIIILPLWNTRNVLNLSFFIFFSLSFSGRSSKYCWYFTTLFVHIPELSHSNSLYFKSSKGVLTGILILTHVYPKLVSKREWYSVCSFIYMSRFSRLTRNPRAKSIFLIAGINITLKQSPFIVYTSFISFI